MTRASRGNNARNGATIHQSHAPYSIPPILHAVAGSFGSALALLLFFPLERVRIEMQSKAADGRTSQVGTETKLEDPSHSQQPSADGPIEVHLEGGTKCTEAVKDSLKGDPVHDSPANSPSNESWIQCSPQESEEDGRDGGENNDADDESWSLSSSVTDNDQYRPFMRSELASCLIRLKQRGELYSGSHAGVYTTAASYFVFFYAHAAVRRYLFSSSGLSASSNVEPPSLSRSLIASSLAGIVNVLVTNPLWVSNLRIVQGESFTSSLLSEINYIFRNEGPAQLWNGTWASLLLVSNPVIQFFTYEQLKAARLTQKGKPSTFRIKGETQRKLSPAEAFVLGAVAKATATVCTYPLQLAQVLLRLQQKKHKLGEKDEDSTTNEAAVYKGTFDCLNNLFQTGGIPALFKGMEAKLFQTVLTAAFTFLTYEQILRVVRVLYLTFLPRLHQSRDRARLKR